MDNFDLRKYLVENKVTTNSRMLNEGFEDLLQQLSAMAEKGEIDNDQIRGIQDTLMSARRQGLSAAHKNDPDYAAKKAASAEKAAATRTQNKKDSEERSMRFKADLQAREQETQEREASNKLPLSVSAYGKGVEGTKKALGGLAKYYSERFHPAGPGGQDFYSLELKPQFQDQSFDDAQIAWDFTSGNS
jgi:hypothetical protein